eukprot:TRINITY_DN5458_c0_g1_i1.p1 TRINITY_DN5458_c0_g1~~TRINITY_DN5458_c0_g1_i1.p1  ORF type:complete len:109 (+),score=13.75 TRINITY_DN5458_c0_g1_i1:162-488(+)
MISFLIELWKSLHKHTLPGFPLPRLWISDGLDGIAGSSAARKDSVDSWIPCLFFAASNKKRALLAAPFCGNSGCSNSSLTRNMLSEVFSSCKPAHVFPEGCTVSIYVL